MESILGRLKDKHYTGPEITEPMLDHSQTVKGLRTSGKRFLVLNLHRLDSDVCQDLVKAAHSYPELQQKLNGIFSDVAALKEAKPGSNTAKVMQARLDIIDYDLPAMVKASELTLYVD